MTPLLAQKLTIPFGDGTETIEGLKNFKFQSLGDVVYQAIPLVFSGAGIGLFIMIVGAGFNFLTSAGDSKKLEKGKQQLTYSIVGFIVVFAGFWLTQIVGKILGIKEIETIFK